MDFQTFLDSAFITGAVSGLLSAAVVDFGAFKKWQSFQQAASYEWGLSAWRWFQGFVAGGLSATIFRGLT